MAKRKIFEELMHVGGTDEEASRREADAAELQERSDAASGSRYTRNNQIRKVRPPEIFLRHKDTSAANQSKIAPAQSIPGPTDTANMGPRSFRGFLA